MTKVECESIIIEKLKEIMSIYHEYNPEGNRLSLYVMNDHYSVNNDYYEADCKKPLSAWVEDDYEEVFHHVVEGGNDESEL